MKLLRNFSPACLSFFVGMFVCLRAECSGAQPVIRTGVAAATQDKPQCKLWFAHEQWWAWLPTPGGSSVYARTSAGWIRLNHLDEHLKKLPGQADVWPAADSVRAVLVGDDRLATADLVYDSVDRTYLPGNLRVEFQWTTPVNVQQGDANADDHLRCAVDQNDVLFVASKNSLDQIDQPQQILRVRQANGTWTNHGYATLTATSSPTRPIAVIGGNPEQLFLLHSVSQKSTAGSTSKIVGISMSVEQLDLAAPQVDVIIGDQSVNNVTGPRHAFPPTAPWIVLASDSTGQVYEADLRDVFSHPSIQPAAK